MKRTFTLIAIVALTLVAAAQQKSFVPVTDKMLQNPSPDDWLMYSRTYDAQRFSPLNQINRQNVSGLKQAFVHEMGTGNIEGIPIVYRGVMYMITPGAAVRAIDATNGNMVWEHKRPSGSSRAKTLAIYEDMVYYTSPDGFIVALDA